VSYDKAVENTLLIGNRLWAQSLPFVTVVLTYLRGEKTKRLGEEGIKKE
jgi:hypothetical protein